MRLLSCLGLGLSALVAGCISPLGDSHSPFQRLYESCDHARTCTAAADGCFTVQNGQATRNMCSLECNSDDDCAGDEAVCGGLPGDAAMTHVCYRRCDSNADCYAGFTCQPTDFTTTTVCMP